MASSAKDWHGRSRIQSFKTVFGPSQIPNILRFDYTKEGCESAGAKCAGICKDQAKKMLGSGFQTVIDDGFKSMFGMHLTATIEIKGRLTQLISPISVFFPFWKTQF